MNRQMKLTLLRGFLAWLLCSPVFPMPTRTTITTMDVEMALMVIHDISSGNFGTLCVTHFYQTIYVPVSTIRFDGTRQKADMAASLIQQVGLNHHSGLVDATCKSLIISDRKVMAARILSLNGTTGTVISAVTWKRPKGANSATILEINGPVRVFDENPLEGLRPNRAFPWYEDAAGSPVWSPKFMSSPANVSYKGWWTFPYYSCLAQKWLISYSVPLPFAGRHTTKGFLSLDVDISSLEVNQCDISGENMVNSSREIAIFYGTHKCHKTSVCRNKAEPGLVRGGYDCVCKPGYYHGSGVFNGTLVEAAWEEKILNESNTYDEAFVCLKCAPGCRSCKDASPCLATYNWTFRITLLSISMTCGTCALALIGFVYYYRKMKVLKVASPIFLAITLGGCSIMYLEMAAIFPVLDRYSCIVTKWTRHMGFCITYTALLMKTWRVSLTYRVKSAHKVKLTDRQLLQWMFPVLLVMIIYLGAWTFSDPPNGEVITDRSGLEFKQCTFNWWDHSLAIGEVIFLAWGVHVCYDVRHAESFYNEARLISFAIYNIAVVNIAMVAFHIFLFPNAGPDVKYLLGFIRTQLSTTVTILLVFLPKILRIWRGQGDEWDSGAIAKGMTPSISMNGCVASNCLESLTVENEFLREEMQRLAGRCHHCTIAHMQHNNRHLKPKPGGPFHLCEVIFHSAGGTQSPDSSSTSGSNNGDRCSNAPSNGEEERSTPTATQTPKETPAQSPTQTPVQTPTKTPTQTPMASPMKTPAMASPAKNSTLPQHKDD